VHPSISKEIGVCTLLWALKIIHEQLLNIMLLCMLRNENSIRSPCDFHEPSCGT